jgi:hypothetical protein
MSFQQPYAMHYQHVWKERSASSAPAWLRVASLAYSRHGRNGHAMFRPGEIAQVLGGKDAQTGQPSPMARQNVYRAIRTAIDNGWLGEASTSQCLVVPQHAIWGGPGKAMKPCPVHQIQRSSALGRTPRG